MPLISRVMVTHPKTRMGHRSGVHGSERYLKVKVRPFAVRPPPKSVFVNDGNTGERAVSLGLAAGAPYPEGATDTRSLAKDPSLVW